MSTDQAFPEPLRPAPARSLAARLSYGLLAVVMTLVGLVGVWLPGLPTTPFILVALWAAARSSDRLSARLRRIRILRAAIDVADDYARHRSLPLRLKILSQVMAYSAIVLVWLVTGTVWITAVVGVGAALSTLTMLLTPTAPPRRPADRETGVLLPSARDHPALWEGDR